MEQAIALARCAASEGEVPVGAVLVLEQQVIASAYNKNIQLKDPAAHAEVLAIRQAAERMGNHRLPAAELFVTVEPCMMCAGMMVHARIGRLVYGATEPKAGVAHSHLHAFEQRFLNHQIKVEGGLLAEQCAALMSDFFRKRRDQARQAQMR